jgi:hypothetical protein
MSCVHGEPRARGKEREKLAWEKGTALQGLGFRVEAWENETAAHWRNQSVYML